jgi:hypothetical protein
MKDSNWKDWLIPLLVVFGIYIPLSTTAPSPERQSPAQPQSPAFIHVSPTVTPTPGQGRIPGEAARLMCDYFGFAPDQDAGLNTQQKSEVENRRGDYCRIKSALSSKASKLGYEEIDYLIATVHDPIDTRLDHQFDRALDAIRRAIESAKYNFDRYWLPWDRSKTAAPAISPEGPKTAQMEARLLRDPGVILFRSSDWEKNTQENGSEKKKRKRLLLLFLVGETATWGIHKAAFQNALQQIKQIEELPHLMGSKTEATEIKKPLRILGPYYPSSTVSLAIPLKEWVEEQKSPPEVSIITGSTSQINKKNFLNNLAPARVSFYATVVDAGQITEKFYTYLRELDPKIEPAENHPDHAKIAFLSEAGTGRGQIVRQNSEPSKDQNPEQFKERPPTIILTYPVHIYQLRVEESKSSSRNGAANAPAVKDTNLPLPMSEAGSPESKDMVPLFSPRLETTTMEMTLREMLTAIHRERIRYIRVSAVDPLDRIFLVQEIRKHCPNATIFMTSADLLYLHSDYYPDFRGARVISSYPLFALNQLWTYPFKGDDRRQQFPTPTEQGIYNATLALLDRTDRMVEYGFPFKTYEDDHSRHPALWLGIVGRNGIWPVKVFDVKPGEYTMCIPTCPSSSAKTSLSNLAPRLGLSDNFKSPIGVGFLLLLGVICLFLSWSMLALLNPFRGRSRMDQADPDQLPPSHGSDADGWGRFLAMRSFIVIVWIAASACCAVAPACLPFRSSFQV